MKIKKLVYGVGVNDADYVIGINETVGYTESGKRILKQVWLCPFYRKWKNMLHRCYSQNLQQIRPTYKGCSVIEKWHYFMNFRAWMEQQDWQGKELDKDLLFPGNKEYSEETCVFVDRNVNSFLNGNARNRGECPIGVSVHKEKDKYQAQCRDVITGKIKHLGYYTNFDEAHQAWLTYKLEQAKILAAQQTDPRVAKALIERYENYDQL